MLTEIELSKMNPAPYNPRVTLTEDMPEYKALKSSLEEFGEVEPIVWNKQTGNIGQAIIVAREKGTVKYSDVYKDVPKYLNFPWVSAANFNTGNNRNRALQYETTMAEFVHNNWNAVKKATSPARGYGGILLPAGLDENGDVIYKYNPLARKETKK